MSFFVTCKHCGLRLEGAERLVGKVGICPGCKHAVVVERPPRGYCSADYSHGNPGATPGGITKSTGNDATSTARDNGSIRRDDNATAGQEILLKLRGGT